MQQANQIQGPEGDPIFGNAKEYYAGRIRFLERMAEAYGDLARYRIGCDWYYMINEPKLARDILRNWEFIDNATTDGNFQLEHSFVAKNGHDRVMPRSIVHSTMCPRVVRETQAQMARATRETLAGWGEGQTLDIVPAMMGLNLEIACQLLFGRSRFELLGPLLPILAGDLRMLIGAYTDSKETAERMKIARRLEIFVELEALITRFVTELEDTSTAPALHVLRQAEAQGKMTQIAIIHELCVVLTSISSTAISLIWHWYCLWKHPDVRERVEAELDALPPGLASIETLEALPYFNAFIKEVLRTYPSLGVLHRKVEASWEREDIHLEKGMELHVSPYLLHRHPRYWNAPLEFRPERFLPDSELSHPDQGVAYLPFGFGVRRCIGETMAWQQLRICLSLLVRAFRVEFAPGFELDCDVTPIGVLRPEQMQIPVTLRARPQAAAAEPEVSVGAGA